MKKIPVEVGKIPVVTPSGENPQTQTRKKNVFFVTFFVPSELIFCRVLPLFAEVMLYTHPKTIFDNPTISFRKNTDKMEGIPGSPEDSESSQLLPIFHPGTANVPVDPELMPRFRADTINMADIHFLLIKLIDKQAETNALLRQQQQIITVRLG